MLVYDRYPLVDGTLFLSPIQYTSDCIEVSNCVISRKLDTKYLYCRLIPDQVRRAFMLFEFNLSRMPWWQRSRESLQMSVSFLGVRPFAQFGWFIKFVFSSSQRFCAEKWDGSSLLMGTMYSFDVFAATPCCSERLKVSFQFVNLTQVSSFY